MARTPAIAGLRTALVAAAAGCALGTQAAPPGVTLLLSEDSAPYHEAARQARAEIMRDGGAVQVGIAIAAHGDGGLRTTPDHLVVALGGRAAERAAAGEARAAILNALLPRRAFEAIATRAGRAVNTRYSALYLDQPEVRQLNLIRAGLPGREAIGLVASADSRDTVHRLQQGARERKLRLIVGRVNGGESVRDVLQDVLAESDVLLALPDAQVLAGSSLQNMLLSAYRYRRPVVGYSAAYLRAGALMAVYSTPAQVGYEVGQIVRAYSAATGLPPAHYPRHFSVDVNDRLARSLDLVLDDPSVLEAKLRRMEEQR